MARASAPSFSVEAVATFAASPLSNSTGALKKEVRHQPPARSTVARR